MPASATQSVDAQVPSAASIPENPDAPPLHSNGSPSDANHRKSKQPGYVGSNAGLNREELKAKENRDINSTRQSPRRDSLQSDAGNEADVQSGRSVWLEHQDNEISSASVGPSVSGGRFSLDARRPQLTLNSPNKNRSQGPQSSRAANSENSSKSKFKVTLIRRDPARESQWNVGTISNVDGEGGCVDIDISTPGYSKFIGSNGPDVLAGLGLNTPKGQYHHPSPAFVAGWFQNNATSTEIKPGVFHRKLYMTAPSSPGHRRDKSTNSPDPTRSPELGSRSSSKLKSGYYTFASPWNGICTFVQSVNGRSLKCKHMIASPSSRNTAVDRYENPAVTVAEIRFNSAFPPGTSPRHQQPPSSRTFFKDDLKQVSSLPSTLHSTLSSDFFHPHSKSESRSGRLPFFRIRSHSDSSTDQDENTVSLETGENRLLSLAREHAGGGLRGKSAKLGKLIIEDEGIRMLDLVVAACMGVWWRSFYS
jgi:hypothetical protein